MVHVSDLRAVIRIGRPPRGRSVTRWRGQTE
jgi:hypothetical protein